MIRTAPETVLPLEQGPFARLAFLDRSHLSAEWAEVGIRGDGMGRDVEDFDLNTEG